ncbi:hypothetical protein [Halorussus marinus]|uniref:hypothetical protein n=1 Tax=Halorussus marinus TaxID=2505976 RepID=UPI00106E92CC|nr:hypothetical protein [Halorussus marinus]
MPSRTNTPDSPARRRVLATGSLALVGGAGCLDYASVREAVDAGTEPTDSETETADGGTETDSASESTVDGPGDRFRIAVSESDGERELLTGTDVASVGDVEQSRQGGYQVRMTLTDDGAAAFTDGLERAGAFDDPGAHEIRTYLDGERVQTATLGRDLAAAMADGEWDGRLLVRVSDREAAERLRDAVGNG